MKTSMTLALISLIVSTTTHAQSGEGRDYGDLIPQDHFQIKHEKTSLKEKADISNYQISVTPKKEEFTYRVNDIKTPRKGVFGKKRDFKLVVSRSEEKISRITSVSFTQDEDAGSHQVQSTSLLPSGTIKSQTICSEDYKRSILGTKKGKSGFHCVTVSPAICEYLKKNDIGEELIDKLNSCSDLLGKVSAHQEHLLTLSKDLYKEDVAAIKEVNGNLPSPKNFYEMKGKTLKDVSGVVLGYGNALSHCESLEEKAYFAPKPEPSEESDSSSSAGLQ